jgi:hypothetical protein
MEPPGILVIEPDNSATAEQNHQDEMVRRKIGTIQSAPERVPTGRDRADERGNHSEPGIREQFGDLRYTANVFTRSDSEKPRSPLNSCRTLSPSKKIAKVDFSDVNDHLKAHENSKLRV